VTMVFWGDLWKLNVVTDENNGYWKLGIDGNLIFNESLMHNGLI
jgi:hypothetical protein